MYSELSKKSASGVTRSSGNTCRDYRKKMEDGHRFRVLRSSKLILILVALIYVGPVAAQLTEEKAYALSQMPLHCIGQEWPNKTSHMSDGPADHRLLPSELHPAFYGCLDWHSSVHGHWLLVKVLKLFPAIKNRDSIVACLAQSFSPEKMKAEAAYFSAYTGSSTFERTYGWAWLLKLDEELMRWDDPLAGAWHRSMAPLTARIVELWQAYLPRQSYANRTGVHPNTAFGLAFALDWARETGNREFEHRLIDKAMQFYHGNQSMPSHLEPDASDFFSPSLLAADLMRRILSREEYVKWVEGYFTDEGIRNLITPPVVSDRTDYQIVHLDGLSFSRAWCMKGIAQALPEGHRLKTLFESTASRYIGQTLPVIGASYGGSHWLASFALYALDAR